MKVEIAYRVRYTGQWFTPHASMLHENFNIDMFSLVIDGQRTFHNESLTKVQTVQRRVVQTAKLLELSQIA